MINIILSTKQIKNVKNPNAVETQWDLVPGNWDSQLRIFTWFKKAISLFWELNCETYQESQ